MEIYTCIHEAVPKTCLVVLRVYENLKIINFLLYFFVYLKSTRRARSGWHTSVLINPRYVPTSSMTTFRFIIFRTSYLTSPYPQVHRPEKGQRLIIVEIQDWGANFCTCRYACPYSWFNNLPYLTYNSGKFILWSLQKPLTMDN